jgi:hypothetical protein
MTNAAKGDERVNDDRPTNASMMTDEGRNDDRSMTTD